MLIYIVIIIALVICQSTSSHITDVYLKQQFDKKCLIAFVILLSLLSALRYIVPGTDSEGYIGLYMGIRNRSFYEIYLAYPDNPGYYWLSKLFSYSHLSYHFWFGFVGLIYYGSLALFVNRYSTNKMFSILMAFTIGILGFTLSGEKQTLAMGGCLFAFLLLDNKKYLPSLLVFVLATLCHKSSFIFLPCIFLYLFRERKDFWFVLIPVFIIMVLWGEYLMNRTITLLDSEHYNEIYLGHSSKYAYTELIFYIVLYISAWLQVKGYSIEKTIESRFFYSSSLLCLVFQSFARFNADYFRFALYYIPFMVVLIPNACSYDKKKGNTIKMVVSCLMIFFMLYTCRNSGYRFLWQ